MVCPAGSVPLEKIQNILSCNRGPYTDLYHVVVGKGKGKLKAFLQQYPDTFQHFAIEDGKWRLRLTKHTNYEFADREERRVREREVKHFLDALQMYLEKQPSRCCKVRPPFARPCPNAGATSTWRWRGGEPEHAPAFQKDAPKCSQDSGSTCMGFRQS